MVLVLSPLLVANTSSGSGCVSGPAQIIRVLTQGAKTPRPAAASRVARNLFGKGSAASLQQQQHSQKKRVSCQVRHLKKKTWCALYVQIHLCHMYVLEMSICKLHVYDLFIKY